MISLAGSYDFETFFGKKGGRLHANETKPSQRKGKANAYENNEAEPVTIGYRLGFESMYKTQAIVQLTISSAVCTGIPGLSRRFEPSSANAVCIPGTERQARLAPMRLACDAGRRLGLDTQLQGAQVACQLVLLTRRDHGGHSRANGLLAAEAGFGKQLAHQDDVG